VFQIGSFMYVGRGDPAESTDSEVSLHDDLSAGADRLAVRNPGSFRDYLAIARLNHSTKHIFVVPGILLALMLRGPHTDRIWLSVLLGFVTVICIASANYAINEWLDRDFDRHHPTKSARSAVQSELSGKLVALEWLLFVAVGLIVAALCNKTMFCVAVVFAGQGIVYNVPPIRSKDRAYVDVISESINNPLRFMIGWSMIDPTTLPPSSILLAYWLGGAFLMAAKRLSEYRQIAASHGKSLLARYRASFAVYSEVSLTASCFLYALLSSFFIAVFLIKYRIEYIILFPVLSVLFVHYLILSMHAESSAQNPEKLFREGKLMALLVVLGALFVLATFVDLPLLDALTSQHYIVIE
jgi:4-hydroxybenzoate polyprenyltransferase